MAVGRPSRQGAIFPAYRVPGCGAFHAAQRCARHMAARCRLPTALKSASLGSIALVPATNVAGAARRKQRHAVRRSQPRDPSPDPNSSLPSPGVMAVWYDHGEVKTAAATRFTSKALALSLSDHAGTHVDAPCHFNPDPEAASIDQVPLENFYTEAICLDLTHVPLRHEITVAEMEEALQVGQEIRPRDTVLFHMGVNTRLVGTPGYLHDFPVSRRCRALAGGQGYPHVRRRSGQSGPRGRAQLQGPSCLCRARHNPHRVPLEPR